ncbi:MAG TPA: hypothetical protein VNG90_05065 [Candidatus Acidoferrum sp.]|nr:hypothetical protein [Candidatus Acidoferrum sp.]
MFTSAQAMAEFLEHQGGKTCSLDLQGDLFCELRRRFAAEAAIIKMLPSIQIVDVLTRVEGRHIEGQGFEITFDTLVDGPWHHKVVLKASGQGATFPEAEEQTLAALCSQFREIVMARLPHTTAS